MPVSAIDEVQPFSRFLKKSNFHRLLKNAPASAEAASRRQMQGSSFDKLRINSPEGRGMRGAVATNKEQLLARP